MAVRRATSSAGRLFFSPFDALYGDCADIMDTQSDIRLTLAIYTAAVYIYRCREGTGIETAPRRQSVPAGRKEMHRTGGVAKQGKRNPAGRGFQSPERYRGALSCPETRVRFPRRGLVSQYVAEPSFDDMLAIFTFSQEGDTVKQTN